ncbi:MAG: FCD domain-containing protein [Prevotellaceae bacterium]|jgi:DNA-binding FadR family transcriptional regulator|nr:FCD domain-containing protein [Prevotellaceae bacterium]
MIIREKTLAEQTEKKMLEYISNHNFKVDELLPTEDEFTGILGVSRVVVREALSRLRMLGVVETRRKRGTVLKSPDFFGGMQTIIDSGTLQGNALKDLFELRLMLEIGMSDFIFMRKTDADLERLQAIVDKEELTLNTEESIRLDIKFHSILYEISGNQSLKKFQQLLEPLFSIYAPRAKNWKVKQIIQHNGLLEILRRGSPEAFRTGMRLHLSTQFESMSDIFQDLT